MLSTDCWECNGPSSGSEKQGWSNRNRNMRYHDHEIPLSCHVVDPHTHLDRGCPQMCLISLSNPSIFKCVINMHPHQSDKPRAGIGLQRLHIYVNWSKSCKLAKNCAKSKQTIAWTWAPPHTPAPWPNLLWSQTVRQSGHPKVSREPTDVHLITALLTWLQVFTQGSWLHLIMVKQGPLHESVGSMETITTSAQWFKASLPTATTTTTMMMNTTLVPLTNWAQSTASLAAPGMFLQLFIPIAFGIYVNWSWSWSVKIQQSPNKGNLDTAPSWPKLVNSKLAKLPRGEQRSVPMHACYQLTAPRSSSPCFWRSLLWSIISALVDTDASTQCIPQCFGCYACSTCIETGYCHR